MTSIHLLRAAGLAAVLGCSALVHAEAPADWMGVPGASAERVAEPVFGGSVMLYRAGRRGAEPVVLVHGLGQNGARDWRGQIAALAERYEVFALDLPGFGASGKGNHLYSPENFGKVIEAAVAPRVGRPFALIGHSMGGAVALGYAAAYPQRVSRLVLVSMAGVLHRSIYAQFLSAFGAEYVTGVDPGASPWFGDIVRRVLGYVENVAPDSRIVLQSPMLRERLLRGDPNTIAAHALVEHDFSHALRAVRAPTLLIWGREDRIAPLRTAELAAATLPGARILVIDGAAHMVQLDAQERFNAVLRAELSGLPTGAGLAPPPAADGRARDGNCEGEAGQRFSGVWRRLTLDRCSGASIRDARIDLLVLLDSSVEIVHTQVVEGVRALNSSLLITGGSIGGHPALTLHASRVDAAGTRFETPVVARNTGGGPVTLTLSVSERQSPGAAPRNVHERLELAPQSNY